MLLQVGEGDLGPRGWDHPRRVRDPLNLVLSSSYLYTVAFLLKVLKLALAALLLLVRSGASARWV